MKTNSKIGGMGKATVIGLFVYLVGWLICLFSEVSYGTQSEENGTLHYLSQNTRVCSTTGNTQGRSPGPTTHMLPGDSGSRARSCTNDKSSD